LTGRTYCVSLLISWGAPCHPRIFELDEKLNRGKVKVKVPVGAGVQSWPNLAKPDLTPRGKRNSVWTWKVRAFHCNYDK
jgi:hypothetical protein